VLSVPLGGVAARCFRRFTFRSTSASAGSTFLIPFRPRTHPAVGLILSGVISGASLSWGGSRRRGCALRVAAAVEPLLGNFSRDARGSGSACCERPARNRRTVALRRIPRADARPRSSWRQKPWRCNPGNWRSCGPSISPAAATAPVIGRASPSTAALSRFFALARASACSLSSSRKARTRALAALFSNRDDSGLQKPLLSGRVALHFSW